VAQNKRAVKFEVVPDIGQTLEDRSGHSDTEPKQTNRVELTTIVQNVEDYNDTEPTSCTV